MATRLYFSTVSRDVVTPSSWGTWGNTANASTTVRHLALRPSSVVDNQATITVNDAGGAATQAIGRWVSPPLDGAQTISGTVSSLIVAGSAGSNQNSLRFGLKVIQSDGTDRGTLLATTGGTSAYQFGTAQTVRYLRDSSDNTSITLSSVSASDGDRIVVEIGAIDNVGFTTSFSLYPKNNATSDLANESDTSKNTWIEFSGDLLFQPAHVHSVTVPVVTADDTSGTNATTTVTLDPFAPYCAAGDLVVVYCGSRASATWSVGVTGGQTWTSETALALSTSVYTRKFWCVFNGTWDASPRFDSTDGTSTIGVMLIFSRGRSGDTWAVGNAQSSNEDTSSPFAVTGVTTTQPHTLVLATWVSADDNGYSGPSGTGWFDILLDDSGGNEVGNTSGLDHSVSFAFYRAPTSSTATGDVTKTQTARGPDTTLGIIQGWYVSSAVKYSLPIFRRPIRLYSRSF